MTAEGTAAWAVVTAERTAAGAVVTMSIADT